MFHSQSGPTLRPELFKPRVQAGRVRYTPRFATAHAADMAVKLPPPVISGDTQLRIVDNTFGWRELKRFRSGWSGQKAEEEVRETAQELAAGIPCPVGNGIVGPHYQRVIALEHKNGDLISWCGITRRHLCEGPMPFDPGIYFFAIATSWKYRGQRLDARGTRPADAVMRFALEVGRADLTDDGVTPYAWARVLPHNGSSNRLFDDHLFDLYTAPQFVQMIRARPKGLDPAACRWRPEHPLAA